MMIPTHIIKPEGIFDIEVSGGPYSKVSAWGRRDDGSYTLTEGSAHECEEKAVSEWNKLFSKAPRECK